MDEFTLRCTSGPFQKKRDSRKVYLWLLETVWFSEQYLERRQNEFVYARDQKTTDNLDLLFLEYILRNEREIQCFEEKEVDVGSGCQSGPYRVERNIIWRDNSIWSILYK